MLSKGFVLAALAVVLVAAAAGAAAYHFWPRPAAVAETSKPSIAVLPFANLGGDAASGRLAEGLTDDIITDLTRYRDFDIIARNSLEAYRSRPTDVRKIRDELSVRYLLEGSIQRADDRVRVTAQLIDVATGTNIWSERWDRPATDVFAVQSEVAEHTASAVAGSDLLLAGMNAEARRKLPQDLQAYDLTVLAYQSLLTGTEAATVAGINYSDQAISRDPNFARAYVQKAWLVQELAKYRRNWNEASLQMEELARIAIRLDPYDANAHILLAWTLGTLGRNSEALEETTRALELNPSSADILNMAADTMAFLGKPDEGLAMCDRSFRLNPTPPDWYSTDCVSSFYFAGRYEQAVDAVNRGSVSSDPSPSVLVWKAASEAELGRTGAATGTVKRLEQLYWEVSFEWLLNTGWNFERDEERDKILASAKKAGVRICATAEELVEFASPTRLPECEAQTSG
jgi:TolB-like protein